MLLLINPLELGAYLIGEYENDNGFIGIIFVNQINGPPQPQLLKINWRQNTGYKSLSVHSA